MPFQVSAPELKVSPGFRLQDWFISRFLASILLDIGACPLFLSVGIFDLLPSCGQDGYVSTISFTFPQNSLFFCLIHVYVCCNFYGLMKKEVYIIFILVVF